MDPDYLHDRYPVSNFIPVESLPKLPSTPFPFATYAYRRGTNLPLDPLTTHPLGNGKAQMKGIIVDHIEVAFGCMRQRVRVATVEFGTVEALIFDSLYVDICDLPNIRMVEFRAQLMLGPPEIDERSTSSLETAFAEMKVSQQHPQLLATHYSSQKNSTSTPLEMTSIPSETSESSNSSPARSSSQMTSTRHPTLHSPPSPSKLSQGNSVSEIPNMTTPSHTTTTEPTIRTPLEDWRKGIREAFLKAGIVPSHSFLSPPAPPLRKEANCSQRPLKRILTVKQSRKAFSTERFVEEADAYFALRARHGKQVPACFGAFTLHYPERECEEDRSVGVLLIEALTGSHLSQIPRYGFTDLEAKQLIQSILETLQVVNSCGVYFTTGLDQRFIIDHIGRKVKVGNFLYCSDRSECDEELQMSAVRGWLDLYGYSIET
jgi:hypothetical protein